MPHDIDRREVKNEARDLLQTASVPPIRFTLFFFAINLALELVSTTVSHMLGDSVGVASLSFSFIGILISLLGTVLLAGYTCYSLGVQRGEAMPYESLFDAFPFAGRVILLEVFEGLLIGLGMLLFIVPGVMLALAYAPALMELCEHPEAGALEALRVSRTRMRGYKGQLFLLQLSFWPLLLLAVAAIGVCEYYLIDFFPATLGGDLLAALCLGAIESCAQMYLLPYFTLSQAGFYRRLVAAEGAESGG